MNTKILKELLTDHCHSSPLFWALLTLVDYMDEADDGTMGESSGNIGLNFTSTEIDVVDLVSGTSLATITISFND